MLMGLLDLLVNKGTLFAHQGFLYQRHVLAGSFDSRRVSTTEVNNREVETISFTSRTRLLGRNSKA